FFRRTFFERNLEKVREDLEYALATVTKILNKGTDLKVIDKIKDKDEEIKKLREEMEKLGN
ncbi:MAG: hypothetical protein GX640_02060, partial [Fibrobacter sp.]|nr:hypothetical protein [Fibrobacter sp.]